MCSFVYVNFQLQAALPNKDWVKKNVSTQKIDKVDKEFKCEKNNPIDQKTKN